MNNTLSGNQIQRIVQILKEINEMNQILEGDEKTYPLWKEIENIYLSCLDDKDRVDLGNDPKH